MRVIVTGSRDWTGVYATQRIHTILELVLALADALGRKLTVVHGDCPTGADRTVDNWARRRENIGVSVEPRPAMVSRGADMCIGFVKGDSRATRGTLALAREVGIPTFMVPWEEDRE